jgi:RimJ/RimL family protein N-acetyltransferase
VIGIRASHAEHGLGTQLLTALDTWAIAAGIHRLELTVMAHNRAAIGLYLKAGYHLEGTRRAALIVETKTVDELWMAKLLSPPEPSPAGSAVSER